MRRLEVADYTVSVRNEQAVAKFKADKCKCGLALSAAEPVDVRVKSPSDITGKCPQCDAAYQLAIPEFIQVPYSVKDSLIELLLAKNLELNGRELIERDKIGSKILACSDGQILLEEEEWNKMVRSAENVKGLGRADVVLIRRIFEAEQVEVEEKKEETPDPKVSD